MRFPLALALGVLVGLALPAADAQACTQGIVLHGVRYTGLRTVRTAPMGSTVPGGTWPGCGLNVLVPVGGSAPEPPPPKPVALRHLAGVLSRVAVVDAAHPRRLFLAPGYLVPRAGVLGRLLPPLEPDATRCGATTTLSGHLPDQPTPFEPLDLTRGRRETTVALRPSTAFSGRRRDGLPYVAEGSRVVATGRMCTVDDGLSRALVADAVAIDP